VANAPASKNTRMGCLYKLLKRFLLACLLLLLALSATITYIVRQRPQTIEAPCDAYISTGSLEQLIGGPAEEKAKDIAEYRQRYSGNILIAFAPKVGAFIHYVPTLGYMLQNIPALISARLSRAPYFDPYSKFSNGFSVNLTATLDPAIRTSPYIPWHIPPFANSATVRLAIPAWNATPGLLLSMPRDSNRLDMALRIDADWATKSNVPMLLPPQGQHAPYVALACPSGASATNIVGAFANAAHALLHGVEIDSVRWLRHPGVQALLSQPTPVVAVFSPAAAPGAKAQLTLLFPDKREPWVMDTLRAAQLDAALIPETFGAWNAIALPPSATAGTPLVGWLADCVAIASTPQAFDSLPTPPHFAPHPAPAAIGFAAEGHLDTYNGVLLPDSPELIPGDWLLFTANPSIEAAVANLIRPAELCELAPENEATKNLDPFWYAGDTSKPYNAHYQIQTLLAAGKIYHARDLWQRWAPRGLKEEPGAVYAPRYWIGFTPNPTPLVTESAWCILNSCALYTAPEGGDRVKDWADFLVDWKRGPDAAPLSTIEESANQDDLYPLVTVWLGLRTATNWMYPEGDNVPARWTHRIEELQTEISARLLRPGQCLTRRDYLLPLLQKTPGLSPAALDALARLPECPLSETRFLGPAELPSWLLPAELRQRNDQRNHGALSESASKLDELLRGKDLTPKPEK